MFSRSANLVFSSPRRCCKVQEVRNWSSFCTRSYPDFMGISGRYRVRSIPRRTIRPPEMSPKHTRLYIWTDHALDPRSGKSGSAHCVVIWTSGFWKVSDHSNARWTVMLRTRDLVGQLLFLIWSKSKSFSTIVRDYCIPGGSQFPWFQGYQSKSIRARSVGPYAVVRNSTQLLHHRASPTTLPRRKTCIIIRPIPHSHRRTWWMCWFGSQSHLKSCKAMPISPENPLRQSPRTTSHYRVQLQNPILSHLALDDKFLPKDDIWRFLEDKYDDIRRTHPLKHFFLCGYH